MKELIKLYSRYLLEISDICPITDEQMWKLEATKECYEKFIAEMKLIEGEKH